jgi:hypothetical protein
VQLCLYNPHFTTFYLRIQLTEAVSGAKQVLKGLCPHEQLHHSTALCPKVVTDKVRTCSLLCCVCPVRCSFRGWLLAGFGKVVGSLRCGHAHSLCESFAHAFCATSAHIHDIVVVVPPS